MVLNGIDFDHLHLRLVNQNERPSSSCLKVFKKIYTKLNWNFWSRGGGGGCQPKKPVGEGEKGYFLESHMYCIYKIKLSAL